MTMTFVNGKKDGAGNTIDVTSGQHPADRMCNIFDLEENYYEYVAEKNSCVDYGQFVDRGGYYVGSSSASHRSGSYGNASSDDSFRFTLYVM